MRKLIIQVAVAAVLSSQLGVAAEPPAFVPLPRQVTTAQGEVRLSGGSRIMAEKELLPLASVLSEELAALGGAQLPVDKGRARAGDICIEIDSKLKPEAYALDVTDRIVVRGGDYAGAAWGTVTLLQAAQLASGVLSVPAMSVADEPKAGFRALMVDVARQWHEVDVLKGCIELCRLYKLRYLQLHLTDGEAWTFPSKAYPRLGTNNWHGGRCYTFDEMRDLVSYADRRGVTIIPEIETPGHSGAAARGMPEVFDAVDPATGKAVGVGCMNMANEKLYEVLETLLGEVAEMFASSPYIHIGCDEVWLGEIHKSPQLKDALARQGLKNPHELFMRHIVRMNDMVKKLHKQTLVWEGFAGDGGSIKIPKDILVMAFENTYNPAPNLLQNGYTIVNTAWTPLYVLTTVRCTPEQIFDWNLYRFGRFPHGGYERVAWLNVEPTPGVVGAMMCSWEQPQWSEIPSLRNRAPAMSERIWNPDSGRQYADFSRRFAETDLRFACLVQPVSIKAAGLYHDDPSRAYDSPAFGFSGYDPYLYRDAITVTLASPRPLGTNEVIRYTLDDKAPTAESAAYTAPLRFTGKDAREMSRNGNYPATHELIVRARLFVDGQPAGAETVQFYRHDYIAAMPRKVQCSIYELPGKTNALPADLGQLKLVTRTQEPWINLRGMPHLARPESAAVLYEGRIALAQEGDYEFQLRSCGGTSQLFLDGKLLVDRTATDWGETVGKGHAAAGLHELKAVFVGSGDFFTLDYRLAGADKWTDMNKALEAVK